MGEYARGHDNAHGEAFNILDVLALARGACVAQALEQGGTGTVTHGLKTSADVTDTVREALGEGTEREGHLGQYYLAGIPGKVVLGWVGDNCGDLLTSA